MSVWRFIEIVREADAYDSPVRELVVLDERRCYSTPDPLYPVIYDGDQKAYLLKWYQVMDRQAGWWDWID